MQGWRRGMEDSHTIYRKTIEDENGENGGEIILLAVYDGHCGSEAAKFAGEKLCSEEFICHNDGDVVKGVKELLVLYNNNNNNSMENNNNNRIIDQFISNGLQKAFLSFDEVLKEKFFETTTTTTSFCKAGATACVVMLVVARAKNNNNNNTKEEQIPIACFCANAGDSRAILMFNNNNFIPLSTDHKPYLQTEALRIRNANGFVWNKRVNGVLALSRAIGDFQFKQNKKLEPQYQAVTALPEIKSYYFNNNNNNNKSKEEKEEEEKAVCFEEQKEKE
eukprot:PhM_4_TR13731/c6_g1_i2/m.25187/K14803/PTC2_3; protein phosphatase PTC2/3